LPRHLAIGDIHGCYKALKTLVDYVGLQADDVLITLGDYVNRGPNTKGVLEWLIEYDRSHTLVPLRGNHDLTMLHARKNSLAFKNWLQSGGDAVLRSYAPPGREGTLDDIPDAHWQFLKQRLVATHETEGHIFVHGSVDPDLPLDEQPPYMLYVLKYDDPPLHRSGKVTVCGHTSQKSGLPITNGNAICIDTAACKGGWLTCLHVESGMIWQANEAGETREMCLDDLK
jgi:serine/threonine protein phosphatase 1